MTPSAEPATTTYSRRDYRGSIVATSDSTDPATSLGTRVIYDPLGSIFSLTGPDNLWRKFSSLTLDKETGLYDHGPRYLNSNLGRFLRADSGVSAHWTRQDAQNRYAYALNAATSAGDPDGRSFCQLIGMTIVGVVTGVGAGLMADYSISDPDTKPKAIAAAGVTVGVGGFLDRKAARN